MPEFGGPDPAPNDPSDRNIQPRHLLLADSATYLSGRILQGVRSA
jgi:hypothetical protein